MKKPGNICMLLVASLCLGLLTGFFILRNTGREPMVLTETAAGTGSCVTCTSAAEVSEPETSGVPAVLNINTASSEELQTLPGIGPVLADRIVVYRQQHGPFHSSRDLMNIKGIGEERFSRLIGHIVAGG